jgi:hypothetical protein
MWNQESSHTELNRNLGANKSVFAWFVSIESKNDQRNLSVEKVIL